MTTEFTPIPARILLQVREGVRHNVLAEFHLRARESRENEDGAREHDVATTSIIEGFAKAMRDAVSTLVKDDPSPETRAWLADMQDWTFGGFAS